MPIVRSGVVAAGQLVIAPADNLRLSDHSFWTLIFDGVPIGDIQLRAVIKLYEDADLDGVATTPAVAQYVVHDPQFEFNTFDISGVAAKMVGLYFPERVPGDGVQPWYLFGQ